MKTKLFMITITTAFSLTASAYQSPLLTVIRGGILRSDGKKVVCEIFDNNAAVKDRVAQIQKDIVAAKEEPIVRALHAKAEDPSVEVYANRITGGTEQVKEAVETVFLHKDAGTMEYRDGPATDALREIAFEVCK